MSDKLKVIVLQKTGEPPMVAGQTHRDDRKLLHTMIHMVGGPVVVNKIDADNIEVSNINGTVNSFIKDQYNGTTD